MKVLLSQGFCPSITFLFMNYACMYACTTHRCWEPSDVACWNMLCALSMGCGSGLSLILGIFGGLILRMVVTSTFIAPSNSKRLSFPVFVLSNILLSSGLTTGSVSNCDVNIAFEVSLPSLIFVFFCPSLLTSALESFSSGLFLLSSDRDVELSLFSLKEMLLVPNGLWLALPVALK